MLAPISTQVMTLDQFHAHLEAVCGDFEVVGAKDQPQIRGYVGKEIRAGLEFAHIAKNVQSVRRTAAQIKKNPGDHFFLIFQETGQALMQQGGDARLMKPGDLMLIDGAAPSEFSFFGHFSRQLSVHLPRDCMIERFGDAAQGGHYVHKTDLNAVALTAILSKAFDERTNDTQKSFLKEAVYGMLGTILYERSSQSSTQEQIETATMGLTLAERGMAYIDRCFEDSELTAHHVALQLGTPIRQLQRAFAPTGTTPTEYIIKKRFEKACQRLRCKSQSPGTGTNSQFISSIAFACGFNDISYFNRQFRQRFGCSPSQ